MKYLRNSELAPPLLTDHTLSVTRTFSQCHTKGKAIPVQALRVPGGCGSQISRQSADDSGKVVSPSHRPPFPQETFLVLISARGWFDPRAIVRPEGLCQRKIPKSNPRLSGS